MAFIKGWPHLRGGLYEGFHCTYITYVHIHTGKILDMSVSPDGLMLCTTSDDRALKIFDVVNFGESYVHVTVTGRK